MSLVGTDLSQAMLRRLAWRRAPPPPEPPQPSATSDSIPPSDDVVSEATDAPEDDDDVDLLLITRGPGTNSALAIPHVVQAVFSDLDYTDLSQCATVNKLWFSIASRRLFEEIDVVNVRRELPRIPWCLRPTGNEPTRDEASSGADNAGSSSSAAAAGSSTDIEDLTTFPGVIWAQQVARQQVRKVYMRHWHDDCVWAAHQWSRELNDRTIEIDTLSIRTSTSLCVEQCPLIGSFKFRQLNITQDPAAKCRGRRYLLKHGPRRPVFDKPGGIINLYIAAFNPSDIQQPFDQDQQGWRVREMAVPTCHPETIINIRMPDVDIDPVHFTYGSTPFFALCKWTNSLCLAFTALLRRSPHATYIISNTDEHAPILRDEHEGDQTFAEAIKWFCKVKGDEIGDPDWADNLKLEYRY